VVFGLLLAVAILAQPSGLIGIFLPFWISVVLAAAVVVTVDASGVQIDDLIRVLEQLHIRSPQGAGNP